MNSGIMNLTSLLLPMIMKLHIISIKRWAAFVMKIKGWGFILLRIRMIIGWRLFLPEDNVYTMLICPFGCIT